jgi:surface protein
VKNMGRMFWEALAFNQPIGSWDVSNVTNMEWMFYYAVAFNQPIGSWDVSNVKNMGSMFWGARAFNQNISYWHISNETSYENIFYNCPIKDENKPSFSNINPKLILIEKNMLSSNNNTCNTKLYNYILTLNDNILQDKRFKFKGQEGIDAGGLSRTVFDLFYKTYIHKFFKYSDENNKDLGMIINYISNNGNIAKFYHATNKLIILAKKGNLQIFMPINEELLKLLKSDNPIQEINLTKKNIYDKKKLLNNRKYEELTKNEQNSIPDEKDKFMRKNIYGENSKISDVLMKKNEKNNNKIWNKNFSNITNNKKKEVYFRRYLHSLEFRNDKHFEIMKEWIKEYWLVYPLLFSNKMPSYAKEDFIQRIILTEGGTKKNLTNNILKNNTNNSIIKKYPNVKVLLEYILNGTDENRKKFCNWATGSIFSNSLITITLNNSSIKNKDGNQVPFQSHSCFNRIDVYQTDPPELFDFNQLNAQVSGNSTSFHIA